MNIKLLSFPVITCSLAILSVLAQPAPAPPAPMVREGAIAQPKALPVNSLEVKGASRLMAIEPAHERQSALDSPAAQPAPQQKSKEEPTFSSLDRPDPRHSKDLLAPLTIKLEQADVPQVLDVYQDLSHRTLIRSAGLPSVPISVRSETPLTRQEALQMLDNVLAANGITMIPLGTKFVKAVPSAQAVTEAAPVVELNPDQLPESSSYMMYIVKVKNRLPREVGPVLQPFAKMPNSIVAIDASGIVILRDYSANIRRMLQVLEKIDQKEEFPDRVAPSRHK